jgi:hypothetical protein
MNTRKIGYPVRLPPELRQRLAAEAEQATRSLHGEIIHRLLESLKQTDQRNRERPAA